MLVKPDGTIYMIDFEQAAQDVTAIKRGMSLCFCITQGITFNLFTGNSKAESIAKAFINGYLKAGGDVKSSKKLGLQSTPGFSAYSQCGISFQLSQTSAKKQKLLK